MFVVITCRTQDSSIVLLLDPTSQLQLYINGKYVVESDKNTMEVSHIRLVIALNMLFTVL